MRKFECTKEVNSFGIVEANVGDVGMVNEKNWIVVHDRKVCHVNSVQSKNHFKEIKDETPISLLMKKLGVEDGEEFDLLLDTGHNSAYNPYRFEDGILLNRNNIKAHERLGKLVVGLNSVRKLKKKSDAEIKLEELEKVQREIADQIAEVRKQLKP